MGKAGAYVSGDSFGIPLNIYQVEPYMTSLLFLGMTGAYPKWKFLRHFCTPLSR